MKNILEITILLSIIYEIQTFLVPWTLHGPMTFNHPFLSHRKYFHQVSSVSQVNDVKSTEPGVEKELIFYPDLQPKEKVMDEDEALYNLFLEQIQDLTDANYENIYDFDTTSTSTTSSNMNSNTMKNSKLTTVPKKQLIEEPTIVEIGTPIEFYYKRRVVFGNYMGRKIGSKGLLVKLPSSEIITIDIGQIISVWDILGDETIPQSPSDWIQITNEALEILSNMSPRKSNLDEFWNMISKRGNGISVDSLDLGIYIFQERSFRSWANPYLEAEESNVIAPTAAQRYVSALLLHNDGFHFKRKLSTYAIDVAIAEVDKKYHNDTKDLVIIEGAYVTLDEGTSMHREGDVFIEYYNQITSNTTEFIQSKTNPFQSNTVSKYLRALELYSMSHQSIAPTAASVKHILKRLKQSLTPMGAKQILLNINYKSDPKLKKSKSNTVYTNLITPWSSQVLLEAQELSNYMENKRIEMRDSAYGKVGKRSLFGRMDYRRNSMEHPVICIDSKKATFLDDGFSLSPSTNEILVHVTDVMETLRRYDTLLHVAKERVSSLFLPTGPLHMLPPLVLDALKLSSSSPNEVLTVAIEINFENGDILGYRVFNAIIGPVFALDTETADELLEGIGITVDEKSEVIATRYGYPKNMMKDLMTLKEILLKVIERNPWVDEHFNKMIKKEYKLDRKTGTLEGKTLEKTLASRMVNALLTIYSKASVEYCMKANICTPIAWENRDRMDSGLIRRYATQPLRNWLSQIQQRQLRAALNMEIGYDRKACAMAVTYVNAKRKEYSATWSPNNVKYDD